MIGSRGMGKIAPSKQPRTIKKRDGNQPVSLYAEGGSVSDEAKEAQAAREAVTANKAMKTTLRKTTDKDVFDKSDTDLTYMKRGGGVKGKTGNK